MNTSIKRTSEEWLIEFGIDRRDILNPDGWDRWNFDVSWAERISLREFQGRLKKSTLVNTPDIRKALGY